MTLSCPDENKKERVRERSVHGEDEYKREAAEGRFDEGSVRSVVLTPASLASETEGAS